MIQPFLFKSKFAKDWESKIDNHIGQEKIKQIIKMHMRLCIHSGKPFPHTLVYGNAGLGKTTIARLIARCIGGGFTEVTAGSIKINDIRDMIRDIRPNDIMFLDESHRLHAKVAEELYSVMQDFKWQGEPVPPFTFIGATTDAGCVPKPLFDRCKIDMTMAPYTADELAQIVMLHEQTVTVDEAYAIGAKSFGTPRVATKYAGHVVAGRHSGMTVEEVLHDVLGIDDIGMTPYHRKVLAYLARRDKPVGIQTLSYATDIPKVDIENFYERDLIRLEFITKTPRGRMATKKGKEYAKSFPAANAL